MSHLNQSYYQTGTKTGVAGTGLAARSALHFGGFGAVIGAASAAAQVIPQVRSNQMTTGQAARQVLKEAAGTGAATAAGAAAAGAIGLGGLVSLATMFGVAVGVKYFWNQALDGPSPVAAPAPALAEPTPEPPAPTKAPAKKATAK